MHFMGKECDVATYTDAYETILAVPIFQTATAYDNPDTGENTIIILNKAVWMGETVDHTLVKPNQFRAYWMTVQDKPFSEAPVFITTKDHDFIIMLSSKGTITGVTTRKSTDKELQTCPHVTCSSAHEWDPQNFCSPESLSTVEEEIARNIGAVMTEGGPHDLIKTDSDSDSLEKIYDISAITSQIIGSVKIASIPSSNVSKKKQRYNMCHRLMRSSQRGIIQPFHLKN